MGQDRTGQDRTFGAINDSTGGGGRKSGGLGGGTFLENFCAEKYAQDHQHDLYTDGDADQIGPGLDAKE